MSRKRGQNGRGREHGRKPTAILLTAGLCKAAKHSGATYPNPKGRPLPKKEVLWDVEVRGLGLRLLPSGYNTWILRFRHRRRERTVTLGPYGELSLNDARKRAMRAKVKLLDGENPFDDGDESPTLDEFAPDFLAHCEQRVSSGEIRASTAAKYGECLKNLRAVLGDRTLTEIDERTTRRAFADITRQRGPYAANRALSVLRLVLRLARDFGYRDRTVPDPTREIKTHREARRGREFSAGELARLGAALAGEEERRPDSADTVAAIRLLALTGARRREITGLVWGEVDFAGRRLCLRTSKTGPREIALNSDAAAILADWHERAEATAPGDRVFPPTLHEVGYAIQYTWKRVRAAAGLPANARLHDLRHTYVTRGIAANFSEALVGRAVGHRSPSTTRRYSHVSIEPTRDLVEEVGGAIAAALGRSGTRPDPKPAWGSGKVIPGPWSPEGIGSNRDSV